MNPTPGIDVTAVERWLTRHVPGTDRPLDWQQLQGGHSNLTYLVTSPTGRRVVVRRSPLGELQPGAHDMHREFRIIAALWPTPVPVPEPLGYCDDASLTGSTFYVMDFVDGRALAIGTDAREWLHGPASQRAAAESYIDVLADLHLLDPDQLALGDLSKRGDFVGRQLRSWYRSWTTSADDAGYDDLRVHEIHALLDARKPPDGALRIVHGDLGMHNCLFERTGRVLAVLDWEVCTLGHPLFDLAYVLNRWSIDGAPLPGREAITMPATFPTASEVIERYAARTSSDLASLDYFITLNHWRSACIVHGVYTRYRRGQKPSEGVDLDGLRATIASRIDAAADAASALATAP